MRSFKFKCCVEDVDVWVGPVDDGTADIGPNVGEGEGLEDKGRGKRRAKGRKG